MTRKRILEGICAQYDGKKCEDCGGPGVSWEDGLILCDDCAILRAKRAQIDGEAGG